MGTRSLTTALNNKGEEIMVLYRQYDGYPSGHGQDLKNFLEDFQICNGFGREQETGKWANGMGCLAAQLVSHFKTEIGEFYLHKSGTRDICEEYIYTITENDDHKLNMTVFETYSGGKVLYNGPIKQFDPDKLTEEEEED